MHRRRFLASLSAGIVAAGAALAPAGGRADTAPPAGPKLTVAVITEYTGVGHKVPPPTAGRPVYVVTLAGGRHDFGRRVAGQAAPSDASLQPQLDAALVADHYLEATDGHPATLALVYTWGLHANPEADLADPGFSNVLDRAALVGGKKFADDLLAALKEDNLAAAATSDQPYGAQLPGMNPVRASSVFRGISPLEIFGKRSALNRRLLDQIANDCYYVVVSAMDYAALVKGERRLVWRTKLSTSAQGSSMSEAIPALIGVGKGFYGRDMALPEFISPPVR